MRDTSCAPCTQLLAPSKAFHVSHFWWSTFLQSWRIWVAHVLIEHGAHLACNIKFYIKNHIFIICIFFLTLFIFVCSFLLVLHFSLRLRCQIWTFIFNSYFIFFQKWCLLYTVYIFDFVSFQSSYLSEYYDFPFNGVSQNSIFLFILFWHWLH